MVKITAARFDSFLKSSVILENIDTIIYKFQLCIYVGHFLKVFIQLYGIFFLLLSEVIYHLLCMCSNSSKWVTKRDREIKIYIFELCGGRGGIFCCGWATSWSQESKIRLPSIPVVHYLLFFSHIPRRKFCFTSISVAAATHTAARQPCFRQSGRN